MSRLFFLKLFDRNDPFGLIVSGFAIASFCSSLESFIPSVYIYAAFSAIGYCFILLGFYKVRHELKFPFGLGYKLLLVVYAIIVVVMCIRGYLIDYDYPWKSTIGAINTHFFHRTYLICWLLPLITLIPRHHFRLDNAIRWSEIFAWFSIICFIIFFKKMMVASYAQAEGYSIETEGISYPALGLLYANTAFISLCSKFINKRVWIINFSALTVSLIILLMAGRRGASATTGAMMILAIYFWINSKKPFTRMILRPLMLVSCIGLVVYGMNASAFKFIQKRGMEDTREAVDKSLINQMDDLQLIFGKGLNGRYYHNLHLSHDVYHGWRYMTETGYYLLVLKGGYVFAWTYILLLLIPSVKGIFMSNNLLAKALGAYMLLSLIELYPWGHPTFNFKFMIIWMGVSLCMSRHFRKLNNRDIAKLFFKQY